MLFWCSSPLPSGLHVYVCVVYVFVFICVCVYTDISASVCVCLCVHWGKCGQMTAQFYYHFCSRNERQMEMSFISNFLNLD